MRRLIGAVLILIALTPGGTFVIVWARHMHTVGLTADLRDEIVLALLALGDLLLLICGAYLVSKPATRKSNSAT